jgi:O-antigen ligase
MLLLVTTTPMIDEVTGADNSSFDTRAEIWGHTAQLVRTTMPAGTGLGSFVSVYPLAEDPAATTSTFINHAHNDALEIALELGVAGIILLIASLAWWAVLVARVWKSTLSTLYARAATIASGALLAHSLVDYPLRTAALAAIFALCLALMAQPWTGARRSSSSRAGSAKHVTIG